MMAVSDLVTELADVLVWARRAVAVFLNVKKTVDSVIHFILIKKVPNLGICGFMLSWFASYLGRRTQVVMVRGLGCCPTRECFGSPAFLSLY